jgi:hypothetical protein
MLSLLSKALLGWDAMTAGGCISLLRALLHEASAATELQHILTKQARLDKRTYCQQQKGAYQENNGNLQHKSGEMAFRENRSMTHTY